MQKKRNVKESDFPGVKISHIYWKVHVTPGSFVFSHKYEKKEKIHEICIFWYTIVKQMEIVSLTACKTMGACMHLQKVHVAIVFGADNKEK